MPSNHLILCHPLLLPSSNESFPMSQFFTSGGQSIWASASASVQDYSGIVQDWLPLVLTVLNVYMISIIIDWYRNIDWQGSGCDRRTKPGGGCDQHTKSSREELPHVRGQGRSREDPIPEGWRPRGVTPRLRSGAVAESARLRQHRNGEKSYPSPRSGAMAGRSYPKPPCRRQGIAAGRSYPTPEARGGGREDQPHVQGAVAERAQEGLEELSHVEGQEGLRWGDTPRPR